MRFFKDMNLARAILVLSLLGSAVLAYTGWKQRELLAELSFAERERAPMLVQQIQQLSIEHTRLARELTGDQWVKEASADSYIWTCGDQLTMGNLSISGQRADSGIGPGIFDLRSTIKPTDAKRQFDRHRIGQFLHRLEANSQRVKVTRAKLALIDRAPRTSEPPADWWTYEVEITTRVRESDSRQ